MALRPARRIRSTVASVCPARSSTPFFLAASGNMWPCLLYTSLQEVAGVLKKTLRASDLSGRVGGDEFIALLHPVSSPAGVRQCVQRICSSVHSVMDRDFNDFSVTCSIGISMYPADGNDIAALVEKADKAAYAVKRKGKNGFAFYSDLL